MEGETGGGDLEGEQSPSSISATVEPLPAAILSSNEKLSRVAKSLSPWIATTTTTNAVLQTAYRCKSSFQILFLHTSSSENSHPASTFLQYAVRENGKPVVAPRHSHVRNIPNQRIQTILDQLQEYFHSNSPTNQHVLLKHWTSLTVCTSWNESEAYVTMNYSATIVETETWLQQATSLAQQLNIQGLTGRAKKQVLRCTNSYTSSSISSSFDIRDRLYLWPPNENGDGWKVGLSLLQSAKPFTVEYIKPEGAFFHPNPTVMCQALEWILNRIQLKNVSQPRSHVLLELYSGCGAHTMALAKSGLLEKIVSVELDSRLVQACRANLELNHILESSEVEIVSDDAGVWARKHASPHNHTGAHHDDFLSAIDTLLVDPPRQGLDEQVCRMACRQNNFSDILYISCGHEALVRDLHRLAEDFEVIDCTLLDLFPGTYSVESLVHLKRRTGADNRPNS